MTENSTITWYGGEAQDKRCMRGRFTGAKIEPHEFFFLSIRLDTIEIKG